MNARLSMRSTPTTVGRAGGAGAGRILSSRPAVVVRPAVLGSARASVAASAELDSFKGVASEEEFFAAFKAEVAEGRMPEVLLPGWADFYNNYRDCVLGSGIPGHDERFIAEVQAALADRVLNNFITPYEFPSFNPRQDGFDGGFDYFEFGQNYTGSLIDFSKSFLGHPERWDAIQAQLDAGENVILLANHQTEADPGVFAHMTIASHPMIAKEVTYVAGDRVVSDPMCIPFSRGRNLFCVHSKRHMDDDPAKKQAKMGQNRKTLRVMQQKLNEGGCLLWIAPSGGRDRSNDDDIYRPAQFDPSAVALMYTLASKAGPAGHIYPMAMYSWPMMPPPKTVDKALGERRITNFTGVGMSPAPELDVAAVIGGLEDPTDREAGAVAITTAALKSCTEEYIKLETAILDGVVTPEYVQPWLEESNGNGNGSANGAVAGEAEESYEDGVTVKRSADEVVFIFE